MTIALLSLAFLAAAIAAAVMGYAIQRGGTCTVAAMEEILTQRRATRLVALAEAALWVTTGLFLAHLAGLFTAPSGGYAPSLIAFAGGMLFGLGALINRACAIGTIARIGSGQWAYIATPAGFYLGCLAAALVLPALMPAGPSGARSSAVFALPLWALVLVLPYLAWRAVQALRAARGRRLAAHVWSPHQATTVIGLAFVVMMLTVGGWAWSELLADLARHGMAANALPRLILFAALLAGAVLGGWTAGRLTPCRPTPAALARALTGGFLMGVATLLIPGGNDRLILVGLPLLQPHAYTAMAGMLLAIGAGMMVERRVAGASRRTSRQSATSKQSVERSGGNFGGR